MRQKYVANMKKQYQYRKKYTVSTKGRFSAKFGKRKQVNSDD